MYKLHFSHQKNVLRNPNRKPVEGIYPIRIKSSDDIVVCVRQDRSISGYKLVLKNSTWVYQWDETIFEKKGNYPLEEYPWLVTDKLLPDGDVIVIKHPNGIRFYEPDLNKPGLKLLKEDGHFHEVYGNKVQWGHFYPDTDELGVITRKINGAIKLFVISSDSLWPNTTYPLFPAAIDTSKISNWNALNSELILSNLLHGQDVFVLRSVNGLEIYRFNDDYLLDRIVHTSQITKDFQTKSLDQLYFANLTKQMYLDILHLNASGLHVYQYNSNQDDYNLIHQNAAQEMTKYSKSIQIADFNNDGKDDLIFTGYNGLKALTFETSNNTWMTLLNTDELLGPQKYSTVIRVLPPMPPKIPQSSLIVQDIKGNIQWANIILDNKPNVLKFYYSTVTPLNNVMFHNEIPERQNVAIPKQISRSKLPQKPFLRWSEQWNDKFLNNAVDVGSGQIRFSVPLVDLTASTGWGLKLALSYSSDETTANLLGIGWKMSISSDYIFVDHQGSIYPEDSQYYLMLQGQPQRLKLLSTDGSIQKYQVAQHPNENITIKYNKIRETWTIENESEQTTYGKANHSLAEDILQWSLEWANWRGSGTNKAQQKPVVQAWYLNSRFDKQTKHSLYYYYDVEKNIIPNGKSYTSGIRLKAIKSNQQAKIIFTYATKSDAEYTKVEPIDNKGNIMFPVSLTEKHYLQEISITTSSYPYPL